LRTERVCGTKNLGGDEVKKKESGSGKFRSNVDGKEVKGMMFCVVVTVVKTTLGVIKNQKERAFSMVGCSFPSGRSMFITQDKMILTISIPACSSSWRGGASPRRGN